MNETSNFMRFSTPTGMGTAPVEEQMSTIVTVIGDDGVATNHRLKIKIKALSENAIMPTRAKEGDVGYDMFSAEDIVLAPMQCAIVKTDIAVELPNGLEAQIRSRSGIAAKNTVFVLNSPGTVDCVPKGTLIKTLSGDIPVEKFLEADIKSLMSYNEQTNMMEEDEIEDIWIVDNIDLIEIEMENEVSIKIPRHKEVYTKRGWIKAENLLNTDEILSCL